MVVGTLSYSRFQALIDQQLRGGKDARTTPARGPTTPPARKNANARAGRQCHFAVAGRTVKAKRAVKFRMCKRQESASAPGAQM